MTEPAKTTCLNFPLSRRLPAGRPRAKNSQSCIEPIQLILKEECPARVYKSWYTPNDDRYPKVAKSASHLDRSHQRKSAIIRRTIIPTRDGAPRRRTTFWFRVTLWCSDLQHKNPC